MSTPIHAQITGSFTATNPVTSIDISLPSGYDKFEMFDITAADYSNANSTAVFHSVGTSLMPADSAQLLTGNGGAGVLDPTFTPTGGFTFIADSAVINNGAPVVITAVDQSTPALVHTGTTTGLVDAVSVVRLSGTTGMFQIAGMDFTVGDIVASTSFELAYLAAAGFAAPATAGKYIKINASSRYYPKSRYITAITLAASAVITMSVTHGFTIGQQVRIIVPSAFGMTQMNNLLGTIIAVSDPTDNTVNSITVNIDSTGFTAFAFPSSAIAAGGVTFAQVIPVGEAATTVAGSVNPANLLDDRTRNISFTGVQIGTTVQTAASSYQWIATKGVTSSLPLAVITP